MGLITARKRVVYLVMPLLGLSLIFLTSCVYDKEMTYLNDQVVALNKRVKSLEEIRGRDREMEAIRSNQASIRAEMDQMQGEMRRLSGRADENQHLVKRAVERDLGDQDAVRGKVKELSDKVAELETKVKKQQEYLRLDESGSPERRAPEQVASKPSEPSRDKPVIGEPKSKEVELYDRALASYKEGSYEEAVDSFRLFLKTYPKSDRADNAYFWIGDSYMGLKQYEQSILAFQEVIKKYPKGNKVPSAMLRQAQAFLEIKDKTSADLLFRKIIKNHPGTSEATIAQKKLDAMK